MTLSQQFKQRKYQGFPGDSVVKNAPANSGDERVQSLSWDDPQEKEMGTHANILAWEIPWTEEPGGYSPGSEKSQT